MTIAQLIAQLQQLEQDRTVLVNGYEDGCEEIERLDFITVHEDEHRHTWYYGRHGECDDNARCAKYTHIQVYRLIPKDNLTIEQEAMDD